MRPPDTLERFDRVERLVHWVNAAMFGVMLFTGASLYIGPLSAIVGRRVLVREIHVICGLSLPFPLALGLIGRWRRSLRSDLALLNRWDRDDWRLMRSLGRDPVARRGKFNPGQKLNAAFIAGSGLLMIASGSIMKWFSPFPDSWRTGATFVHDWVFIALVFVIAGHIWLALSDWDALKGMIFGVVPRSWAERHCPKWVEAYGEAGTAVREPA